MNKEINMNKKPPKDKPDGNRVGALSTSDNELMRQLDGIISIGDINWEQFKAIIDSETSHTNIVQLQRELQSLLTKAKSRRIHIENILLKGLPDE